MIFGSKKPTGFQVAPLNRMVAVGLPGHDSVRLWLRPHRPGTVQLRWWPESVSGRPRQREFTIPVDNSSDHTVSVVLPGDGEPLTPLTAYRFEAIHREDGRHIGAGRFETFPDSEAATPERFSIALASCHQPFGEDGAIRRESSEMLTAVKRCLRHKNTKFLLLAGDQMYADFPESLSLFKEDYFSRVGPSGKKRLQQCTSADIRRLYHERYRIFWNHPEWQDLQREFPCLCILDDHDIIDNWGSREIHQTKEWQSVGTGARLAYFDYQGKRVMAPVTGDFMPDSFHYHFEYGNTATFVMDLRSNRFAGDNGQLYDSVQEKDLGLFLRTHRDKKIIFLVLSVPVIHLPRFIAEFAAKLPHAGEDFSDRWSSGAHIADRDRLLKMLHRHHLRRPNQKIILLSGDIHIGCVHAINWQDGGPTLYQLVSSPITHKTPFLVQLGSKLLISANRNVMTRRKNLEAEVDLLRSTSAYRRNPYGGRNIGMIEVNTPAPGDNPTIKFLLYGRQGDRPVCVYESPPL